MMIGMIKATIRALFRRPRAAGGEVRPIDHGDDIRLEITGTGTGMALYDVDGNRVPEWWER